MNLEQCELLRILKEIVSLNKAWDDKHEVDNYEYYHEHHLTGLRWLDLTQKWPRPGAKSLSRFSLNNLEMVFLSIKDSRENIEAVHHLLTNCIKLSGLQLLATDPLLPYTEIARLKQLQFLE